MRWMFGGCGDYRRFGGFAFPELWTLFDEWLESLEDELVEFAREHGSVTPEEVAERFKISKRAASILLRYVQRNGRMKSRGYEPA